jgi:hypothetical protein
MPSGIPARSAALFASVLAIAFCATNTFAQRAAAAPGPFAPLAGSWSGTGAVTLAGGGREPIRCRAVYNVGGDGRAMRQDLRCASDSYRFTLKGDITVQDGGNITGRWTEATRNAGGHITGRISNGHLRGLIEGTGFSAMVNVQTFGDRQSVSLTSHAEVRSVSINMKRTR